MGFVASTEARERQARIESSPLYPEIQRRNLALNQMRDQEGTPEYLRLLQELFDLQDQAAGGGDLPTQAPQDPMQGGIGGLIDSLQGQTIPQPPMPRGPVIEPPQPQMPTRRPLPTPPLNPNRFISVEEFEGRSPSPSRRPDDGIRMRMEGTLDPSRGTVPRPSRPDDGMGDIQISPIERGPDPRLMGNMSFMEFAALPVEERLRIRQEGRSPSPRRRPDDIKRQPDPIEMLMPPAPMPNEGYGITVGEGVPGMSDGLPLPPQMPDRIQQLREALRQKQSPRKIALSDGVQRREIPRRGKGLLGGIIGRLRQQMDQRQEIPLPEVPRTRGGLFSELIKSIPQDRRERRIFAGLANNIPQQRIERPAGRRLPRRYDEEVDDSNFVFTQGRDRVGMPVVSFGPPQNVDPNRFISVEDFERGGARPQSPIVDDLRQQIMRGVDMSRIAR
tara:strand:- start:11 stop:1348 length:1338 start_codon:yes stop_codon:yes gene_type:complete